MDAPAAAADLDDQQHVPGTHPDRQYLQPGARISILANLKHKTSTRVQAVKVSATVEVVLGAPYQCAVDTKRHPFAESTWFVDVRVQNVTGNGKVATEYEQLDASRVVLRLDQPNPKNRWKGYWWLLQPAAAAAASAEGTQHQHQMVTPELLAFTSAGPALSPAAAAVAAATLSGLTGSVVAPTAAAAATAGTSVADGLESLLQAAAAAAADGQAAEDQQQQQQQSVCSLSNSVVLQQTDADISAFERDLHLALHLAQQQQQQRNMASQQASDYGVDHPQQQQQQQQQQHGQSDDQGSACGSEESQTAADASAQEVDRSPATTDAAAAAAAAASPTPSRESPVPEAVTTLAGAVTGVQQPSAAAAAAGVPAAKGAKRKGRKAKQQQQQQQQPGPAPFVSRRSRAFKHYQHPQAKKPRTAAAATAGGQYKRDRKRLALDQHDLVVGDRLRSRKRQRQQQQQGSDTDSEWEGLHAAMVASMQDAAAPAATGSSGDHHQQQEPSAAGLPDQQQPTKRSLVDQPQQQQQQQGVHSLVQSKAADRIHRVAAAAAAAHAAVSDHHHQQGQSQQQQHSIYSPPQQQQQQQWQQDLGSKAAVSAATIKVGAASAARARTAAAAGGGAVLAAQYRGVYWNHGKFRPQIHIKQQIVRCGAWNGVQAAAHAYDLAALALAGVRDKHYHKGLNFPLQQYAGVDLPDLSKSPANSKADSKQMGSFMRAWLSTAVPKLMINSTAAAGSINCSNGEDDQLAGATAVRGPTPDLDPAVAAAVLEDVTYVTFQPTQEAIKIQEAQRQQQQALAINDHAATAAAAAEQRPLERQGICQIKSKGGRKPKPLPFWGVRKPRSTHNGGRSHRCKAVAAAAGLAAMTAAGVPSSATHWQISAVYSAAADSRPPPGAAAAIPKHSESAAVGSVRKDVTKDAVVVDLKWPQAPPAAGPVKLTNRLSPDTPALLHPPKVTPTVAAAAAVEHVLASSNQTEVSAQRATAAAVAAAVAEAQRRGAAGGLAQQKQQKSAPTVIGLVEMQQVLNRMDTVIVQLHQHTQVLGSSLSQLCDSLTIGPPVAAAAVADCCVSIYMTVAAREVLQQCAEGYAAVQSQLSMMTKMITPHLTTPDATDLDLCLDPSCDQKQSKVVHADEVTQLGSNLLDLHNEVRRQLQAVLAIMGPLSKVVLEAVAAAPPLPAAAGSADVVSRAEWVAGLRSALMDMRDSLLAATKLLGSTPS